MNTQNIKMSVKGLQLNDIDIQFFTKLFLGTHLCGTLNGKKHAWKYDLTACKDMTAKVEM